MWLGRVRFGEAWQGFWERVKSYCFKAWQGEARHGGAWRGEARLGMVWFFSFCFAQFQDPQKKDLLLKQHLLLVLMPVQLKHSLFA